MEGEQALRHAILTTPIIDNHAHQLLKRDAAGKLPLLSAASEAGGDALEDSKSGLAHLQAVKCLSSALECVESWEAVEAAACQRRKSENSYNEWTRTCLDGIQCVLVDDGLDRLDDLDAYNHFDKFTSSPAKRIVRIEHVAARIIDAACSSGLSPAETFTTAMDLIESTIKDAISDPEVVGFKSVICYRTGLAIPQQPPVAEAKDAFAGIFQAKKQDINRPFTRIDHPGLNEYIVHLLAALITQSKAPHKNPIQFHTGLGDNDITLTASSPSNLQPFIRQYPTVPIVLLHSGYPFVRETGYLAAMYTNVYADIGLVFPVLSRHGQEAVVRQILELCPTSKILWSTDGHFFPETYLLAVEQMRTAFDAVLSDFVRRGDVGWKQAVNMVQDMLFNNSNKLYGLNLQMKSPAVHRQLSSRPLQSSNEALSRFLEANSSAKFLRVAWVDMTAMPRSRVIPMRRVLSLLDSGEELSFGVTQVSMALLQNDVGISGCSPAGEWRLFPDSSSLRVGPKPGYVTASGNFRQDNGAAVELCPRTALQRVIAAAAKQGISLVLGFEIELVLLRRTTFGGYEPLNFDGHAWSGSGAMYQDAATSVIERAVKQLDAAGIYVEMVHPESANGQFEIILPKAAALEAVDNLVYARDVVSALAARNGYKMTLHPKPFQNACGTAAHMHMSLISPEGSNPDGYEAFYAGILDHLRAITAFLCSNVASYDRLVDSCWAGGRWVAWGTQNRETPLRKIQDSHWELKIMDGLANPYLAVAAVITAGLDGVARGERLQQKDCQLDPATLTQHQRSALGISEKLPSSIEEALGALEADDDLCELLSEELVSRFIRVKQEETDMLMEMRDEDRRQWILERY